MNSAKKDKCGKCNKAPGGGKTTAICDSCKMLLCGDCHGLSPTEVRVLELKTVARSMTFLCGECKSVMSQLPMIMKKLNDLSEEVQKLRMRQNMLATEAAIHEMTERANRSTNLIIYGVPESISDVADQRKEHDKKECQALIKTLTSKVKADHIKVFRLGAPKSDPNARPRPVKAILNSKNDALEVLRNKNKLSNPSSITSDLTPMQKE